MARTIDGFAPLAVLPDPFPASEVVFPPLRPDSSSSGAQLAPAPVIDKYPIVIGQNLTGQVLSSAYRLGTSGWRYQFVDLLNELLENDPHARGVTRQRVLSVSGGRLEVHPARLPPKHPDTDLAKELAEAFDYQLQCIPAFSQALGQLNWAVVYGLAAAETQWDLTEDGWEILGLNNIHSRRLNYPNPTSWDLYIYDQGLVGPGAMYSNPMRGMYGLRCADFPGKFVAHTPALNGDYPTRDGEGRYIGFYMLLKRMVVRASAQDFERTIRPWVVGYFNRNHEDDGSGGGPDAPVATKEDIAALSLTLQALGSGSMNSATLPNSVKVELLRAASNLNASEFVRFLNTEISKALLGQAFTTEAGANGNLATAQIAKEGTLEILRYDARCLADTLERDLAGPWMRLNYPGINRKLLPRITINIDQLPDPKNVMAIAAQGASIDMPIDMDELAEMTGLPLCPPEDGEEMPRRTRMVAAGKSESPAPEGEEADDAEQASDDSVDGDATDADDKSKSKNAPAAKDKAESKGSKKNAPSSTPKNGKR